MGFLYDTWGGSWGSSWAETWGAPVDVEMPGGGAGSGGQRARGRRQFPFPNRFDDPEVFERKPEPIEAHPIQSEGDPVEVQRPLGDRPGPSSLADLGRQQVLLERPPALPKGPDRAAIIAKAAANAKAASDRRAARRAEQEAREKAEQRAREAEEREREEEEELAVLRFFEYI